MQFISHINLVNGIGNPCPALQDEQGVEAVEICRPEDDLHAVLPPPPLRMKVNEKREGWKQNTECLCKDWDRRHAQRI